MSTFWNWTRELVGMMPRPPDPEFVVARGALGLAALEIARSQIGRGEQGGNNLGPDLDRYRRGGPAGAWCAALLSWCIEEGAKKLGEPCPVKRSHGARRLFKNCLLVGVQVERPTAGDIVCWSRGAANTWQGHIGIVSKSDGSAFNSVEGNVGGYPSKIREYLHELGEARLIGFCRLP